MIPSTQQSQGQVIKNFPPSEIITTTHAGISDAILTNYARGINLSGYFRDYR